MNRARIKEIESIAADILRDAYGTEKIVPPIDMGKVMDNLGLAVRFGEFPDSGVDGAFRRSENAIYINASASYVRQAFTAAHEIGHFILHQDKPDDVFYRRQALSIGGEKGENHEEEKEANCFAASLLMPKDWVEKFWQIIGDVDEMAERFSVSSQAMFFRLRNLGLLG